MQFLILRGHTRLIPQGGLAEFPDAILNAKRLDLFNLYREVWYFLHSFPSLVEFYESIKRSLDIWISYSVSTIYMLLLSSRFSFQVVSRGGFHVGNGINWKGQVFSKMRNHTMTNRMTVSRSWTIYITIKTMRNDMLLGYSSKFWLLFNQYCLM